MNRFAIDFLKVSAAFLFCVGLPALTFLMALRFCFPQPAPPPTDAELRKQFESHREGFEKLRDMMTADGPKLAQLHANPTMGNRAGPFREEGNRRWTRPPAPEMLTEDQVLAQVGLSADRYRTYLALLEAAGVGGVSGDGRDVRFHIHYGGNAKDIVFLRRAPEWPIVADTDDPAAAHATCGAQLAPGWYIEHIRD